MSDANERAILVADRLSDQLADMIERIAALEAQLRERDEQIAKARGALKIFDPIAALTAVHAALALTPDARTGEGERGVDPKLDTPSEWTPDGLHRPTIEACIKAIGEPGYGVCDYSAGKEEAIRNALDDIRALAEPQEKP